MTERPWYDAAFGRGYVELYPHRDLAAARREVAGLLARAGPGLTGPVLDLGCGFGRHLQALRERGIDAFGLDRSQELLDLARGLEDRALAGRLVRGDFRALPMGARTLGGVLMLFSSFGYFDDGENELVLREVARVLRPGGLAVFDLMNPGRVRACLVPESRTRRGELELVERRRLAHDGKRVVKDVTVRDATRGERSWREDVRLYETREFRSMLLRSGIDPLRVEGDFDGAPFEDDAARQVVWARARG